MYTHRCTRITFLHCMIHASLDAYYALHVLPSHLRSLSEGAALSLSVCHYALMQSARSRIYSRVVLTWLDLTWLDTHTHTHTHTHLLAKLMFCAFSAGRGRRSSVLLFVIQMMVALFLNEMPRPEFMQHQHILLMKLVMAVTILIIIILVIMILTILILTTILLITIEAAAET